MVAGGMAAAAVDAADRAEPKEALIQLALYWLFLMGGRVIVVGILPRVGHGRLLVGSIASALFGCLILYSTNNRFGAASGVFFLGAGYASIYPLVAEAIGAAVPVLPSRIFQWNLFVSVGGRLAGSGYGGVCRGALRGRAVIGIPLVGTFLVMALVPLIWLEAKVTGR